MQLIKRFYLSKSPSNNNILFSFYFDESNYADARLIELLDTLIEWDQKQSHPRYSLKALQNFSSYILQKHWKRIDNDIAYARQVKALDQSHPNNLENTLYFEKEIKERDHSII